MESLTQTNVEALLGQLERVRALARRLVRDAASADDLVQDALARALGRPVALKGEPWAWIGATLRNLARDRARGEERRARRERVGARAEACGDAATAVANAELQRELVESVLGLDEPYRTTLLLRFFEDLPPRAIARRRGQSTAAVKKQLERGLQQLRRRLEQRFGERGAWAVALLPVIGPKEVLAPASLGSAALGWSLVHWLPLLALLAFLGVGVGRWAGGPETERATDSGSVPAPLAREPKEVVGEPSAELEERTSARPARARVDARGAAAPESPSAAFAARLVDLYGAPLPGLELVWIDHGVREFVSGEDGTGHWTEVEESERRNLQARSDAAGRVEVPELDPQEARFGTWTVVGRPFKVLDSGRELGPEGAEELVLVLAPTVRVAGRVLDRTGQPLGGASISTQATVEALTTFPLRLRGLGYVPGPMVRSDESGRFDLGVVFTHPELVLSAQAAGHSLLRVPLPAADELELELVLGPARPASERAPVPHVHGWVLEADGRPAPGVQVFLGQERTSCDEQGRFALDVRAWRDSALLSARAQDGRFAVASAPAREEALRPGGGAPIVLHLPRAMLQLRGRLVDEDGGPVSDWRVLLLDRTRLGSSDASLEGSAPGRYRDSEVRTDREGRFLLERLLDRPYRLRFLDMETLFVHDVEGVRAGEQEQLFALPGNGMLAELHGQVVDFYGVPLPGAQVSLGLDMDSWSYATMRGRATASDGRFSFSNVPSRGLFLVVEGPHSRSYSSRSTRFALAELDLVGPVLLRVELPCEVHVAFERDEGHTHLVLLDPEGRALTVAVKHPGEISHRTDVRRAPHGGFPLFEVDQGAAALVLYKGEEELRRIPLRLDPSRRNELQLDE